MKLDVAIFVFLFFFFYSELSLNIEELHYMGSKHYRRDPGPDLQVSEFAAMESTDMRASCISGRGDTNRYVKNIMVVIQIAPSGFL